MGRVNPAKSPGEAELAFILRVDEHELVPEAREVKTDVRKEVVIPLVLDER